MKIHVIQCSPPKKQGYCHHGAGSCLAERDIDFWYDALQADDVESVEKYLLSLGETRKAELLNGHICVENQTAMLDPVKGVNIKLAKYVTYTRLINIATVRGSLKIVEMCLKNGVCVYDVDKNGDNIIHTLIRACGRVPAAEMKYINIMTMFKRQLTSEQLHYLLFQEDNDGRRPLELAAHLGTFSLFKELINTEVYVKIKRNIGILSLHYFDITEYESFAKEDKTRRMKSPMWYFCHLESSHLERDSLRKFFNNGAGKIWCELKIRSNWPLIFLWFLLRLSLAILSQYWNLTGGSLSMKDRENVDKVINGILSINETNCRISTHISTKTYLILPSVSVTLQYILTALAIIFLVFDIVEFIIWLANGWVNRFYRTPDGGLKSIISNVLETRIVIVFISISIVGMCMALNTEQKVLLNLSYLAFQFLLIWSLLYFAQILPFIGPTVINMQRLVKELLSYGIIICALLIPMSYVIASLLTRNYTGPCPNGFSYTDFPQTIYLGFSILLNMVDLTSYPLEEYLSIYAYHLIFVFLISILLLNFIIASFSTTIATMQENQQAIVMIQRLSLAMHVEYRVGAIFPGLIHWLHKRTFQYCPDKKVFYLNELNPRDCPSTM